MGNLIGRNRHARGLAAGILLLRRGRLVIGQRGAMASHPLTWAPFGGKAERGETEEECAVRETYEETSIEVDPGELVFVHERVERNGFRFVTFLARVPDDARVQPWTETHAIGDFHMDPDPAMTWASLPSPLHPGFAMLMRDQVATATVAAAAQAARVAACAPAYA